MAGESKVAVVAALVANLLIALLKLGAGLFANSASMLAEAAHSFSDTGNQVLLLVGIRQSAKPASEEHPYGTAKSAYFWPFLVAVLLFGVAGAYSFFEGVEKTLHPHELGDVRLALGVLGVAIVIEIVSMAIALREARKTARASGITSLRQFIEENRDATLITVLVEDGLALAGLPLAAAAIGMAVWTGDARWDGIGSIVIGVMLMGFSLFLAAQVRRLLIGVGLSKRHLHRVRELVTADPGVERVLSIQSMYLGPQTVLLGMELDMRNELTASEVEASIATLQQRLIQDLPMLKFVYLHPRQQAAVPA